MEYTEDINFTEDKVIVATLEEEGPSATTIYGSTLINTTINS